jgi:hypothetical protein
MHFELRDKDPPLQTTAFCTRAGQKSMDQEIMLDGLPAWTAHSEHQEVWAGPSSSSIALRYDAAFIWSINPVFLIHFLQLKH